MWWKTNGVVLQPAREIVSTRFDENPDESTTYGDDGVVELGNCVPIGVLETSQILEWVELENLENGGCLAWNYYGKYWLLLLIILRTYDLLNLG